MKHVMIAVVGVAMCGMPFMVGCDKTVKDDTTVKKNDDGTMTKDETKVTKSDNGDMTKTVTQSKN